MKNLITRINYNNILAKYLLIICLIYSPFVFFAFVNEIFRLTAFAFLLILLTLKLTFAKIKINQVLKYSFIFTLLIVYCLASLYINNNTEGFRSAIGYSLILILSFLFYININSNINFSDLVLENYIILFNIISISIIINFILNIFFTSINFLTPYFPDIFTYDYNASLFGLSIRKSLLGINISRNFWFFIEPVYTAPFILINIFFIGPGILKKHKYFTILNIISGILTFSYLFYFGYFITYLIKNRPYILLILFAICSALFFYINLDFENSSIFASSSSSDRLLRIGLGFDVLSQFTLTKVLLGSGYIFSQTLEIGVSAGILSSFIESGLIGMLIPLFIALFYIKFDKVLSCILILSLITIEPYKMPFFWIALIIASKFITTRNDVK